MIQINKMKPELKFLGTEKEASVFNLSYGKNQYQMTVPFDLLDYKQEVEREIPHLMPWGDSIKKEIERMVSQNKVSSECYVFLSNIGGRAGHKSDVNPKGYPEIRFGSPFSEALPLLISRWIVIRPEDQDNPLLQGQFSLRWRCVIKKVVNRKPIVRRPLVEVK